MRRPFFVSNALIVIMLTACHNTTLVPGSHIDVRNKKTAVYTNGNITQNALDQHTTVYPITPALLAQLHQPRPRPRANPTLEARKRQYSYRLNSGDVLTIKIWNQPNFAGFSGTTHNNGGTVVDEHGNITYPLAGTLNVRGKSLPQVRQMLTQRLAKYIKNPQIDVNISEFRSQSIVVNGAVKQSGKQPLTDVPLTLVEAITQAGGLNEHADAQHITWTHQGREHIISLEAIIAHGDLSQNQLMSHGDSLFVPTQDRMPVYIMGEVGQQSVLHINNQGLNLTEALAQSRGINQAFADATGVFVIRNRPTLSDAQAISVYQLNLRDATAHALGVQFMLKPNDVVYVTAAPIARWGRVLSHILPSINSSTMLNNTFK